MRAQQEIQDSSELVNHGQLQGHTHTHTDMSKSRAVPPSYGGSAKNLG